MHIYIYVCTYKYICIHIMYVCIEGLNVTGRCRANTCIRQLGPDSALGFRVIVPKIL